MTYKTRNTLVLLLLLLLASAGSGWFIFIAHPAEQLRLRREINDLSSRINSMEERKVYLKQLQATTEEKKETLSTLDKTIERHVSLASVLGYLDEIQDRFGSVKFTLIPEKEQAGSDYGYLRCRVTGEGSFPRLFRLIWALERGPKVFIVEDLSLRGVEAMDPETNNPEIVVPFELTLRAPYANVPELPPLKRTLADIHMPDASSRLVYPLIRKILPPNTDNLLEAERAELRAIISDVALVSDHVGELHELHVGDKVYMGYLTAINRDQNTVEFTLNKGGLVEKHVLRLGSPLEGS